MNGMMVGPLGPPLLENGYTDFDSMLFGARCAQVDDSLRRNPDSIISPFGHNPRLNQTDRKTDSTLPIPTHGLQATSR